MSHVVPRVELGPDANDRADAEPLGDRQQCVKLGELLQDNHRVDAQLPRSECLDRRAMVLSGPR